MGIVAFEQSLLASRQWQCAQAFGTPYVEGCWASLHVPQHKHTLPPPTHTHRQHPVEKVFFMSSLRTSH